MTALDNERHLVAYPRPGATVVVYAVGPAGYGVTIWKDLAGELPAGVELCALRLPGREVRIRQPAVRSIDAQVADLIGHLSARIVADGRPYWLMGACMGAITAFELTRHLEDADGIPRPDRLVVLDQDVPGASSVERGVPLLHTLPTAELLAALFDEAMTADVFRVFEPAIRADLEAAEGYSRPAERRVGADVLSVSEAREGASALGQGWQAATRGRADEEMLAGTGNMLTGDIEALVGLIARAMRVTARSSGPGS
jgi:surfactin synthase thioesterase subunit